MPISNRRDRIFDDGGIQEILPKRKVLHGKDFGLDIGTLVIDVERYFGLGSPRDAKIRVLEHFVLDNLRGELSGSIEPEITIYDRASLDGIADSISENARSAAIGFACSVIRVKTICARMILNEGYVLKIIVVESEIINVLIDGGGVGYIFIGKMLDEHASTAFAYPDVVESHAVEGLPRRAACIISQGGSKSDAEANITFASELV